MPIELILYYDPNVDLEEVSKVKEALENILKISFSKTIELNLPTSTYNLFRKQYNGQKLLNRLIDEVKSSPFLWIVSSDLYVPKMNFVFGLASKYFGALVSFHRLKSLEMKIKESLHECGHVLGLEHCTNYCVMQYSNSLEEALEKPSFLCSSCLHELEKSKVFLTKTKTK
ncbi:MAG: peptidase [Candidatus Heimdallarchaeaceae archaeon]